MNSTSTSTMASDIVTMVTGARGQTTTMTEMSPEPVSARARVARAALATTPPGVMPSTVPVPGIPTQVTVVQQCPPPPPVAGGTLMSSGPYIANVSTAVYSCLSGFYMSGSASISCAGTSSWSGAPPSCFPNRYWRNEYNIGQGYGSKYRTHYQCRVSKCYVDFDVCTFLLRRWMRVTMDTNFDQNNSSAITDATYY